MKKTCLLFSLSLLFSCICAKETASDQDQENPTIISQEQNSEGKNDGEPAVVYEQLSDSQLDLRTLIDKSFEALPLSYYPNVVKEIQALDPATDNNLYRLYRPDANTRAEMSLSDNLVNIKMTVFVSEERFNNPQEYYRKVKEFYENLHNTDPDPSFLIPSPLLKYMKHSIIDADIILPKIELLLLNLCLLLDKEETSYRTRISKLFKVFKTYFDPSQKENLSQLKHLISSPDLYPDNIFIDKFFTAVLPLLGSLNINLSHSDISTDTVLSMIGTKSRYHHEVITVRSSSIDSNHISAQDRKIITQFMISDFIKIPFIRKFLRITTAHESGSNDKEYFERQQATMPYQLIEALRKKEDADACQKESHTPLYRINTHTLCNKPEFDENGEGMFTCNTNIPLEIFKEMARDHEARKNAVPTEA